MKKQNQEIADRGPNWQPIEKGRKYKVHTHLGIYIGVLVHATMDELTLDTCSWVEHEGRMGHFTRTGMGHEASEFLGDGIVVPRNSVKMPFRGDLPTEDV
jgi:hypothetical protein